MAVSTAQCAVYKYCWSVSYKSQQHISFTFRTGFMDVVAFLIFIIAVGYHNCVFVCEPVRRIYF